MEKERTINGTAAAVAAVAAATTAAVVVVVVVAAATAVVAAAAGWPKEKRTKGCEGKRGKERVTTRGRESSVLFARDGRVAIATGGCLLLRPAVVGWCRAVYERKGCGVRGGRRAAEGGRTAKGESKGLGNAVEGIEGRKDEGKREKERERVRERDTGEGNAGVQRGSGGRPHEAEKHTLHQTYPLLHHPPAASSRW